jgi:choline dehydrogenase
MTGGQLPEALAADYVIVGSGSAGSALAARLSEDGRYSVIVVEYGGSDAGPLIQMPGALSIPMNMKRYDWGYRTGPEPWLGGRRMHSPRGKVVGGSSSVNGMVYVRGHARDFDQWQQLGATGWAAADVAPYFQRMEHAHGGDGGIRGTSGPVHVIRTENGNPLHDAFIEAGRQAGFPVTTDYNGYRQEGFCRLERTVWKGRRWSAANAYLRPALKRANVTLVRGLAARIVVRDGTARGVEILRGDRRETIAANREVILAASAFNSPKLLMLSGIGPAQHLREMGIAVVADRPGVGQNLQDHMEILVQYACREPITLNSKMGLAAKAAIGLQWLLFHSGVGATNHFESGAFIRSGPGVEYPDIQFHFLPAAVSYDGTSAAVGHGFQMHVGPMRAASRGRVRLAAPDPAAAPDILFNYMSEESDWTVFRHCIKIAREIAAQPAFDRYRGEEIAPGVAVRGDEALDSFIREKAESAYHPCGTCRMGAAADTLSVVDPECRVIGVERLRVADSSIFPQVTYGNINAPSIMVGEKAADHILGRQPLARQEYPVWINPNWRSSDR